MRFDELNENNYMLFAIKFYDNPHALTKEEFEDDLKRIKYVKRLLKRYHNGFNIIDDVSAEKTISMWIHEEEIETPVDGSNDYTVGYDGDNTYYKLI